MPLDSTQRRFSLNLARISLILTALIFGGFGVLFLLWPEVVELTGVALTTPAATTEIRGFYGGMEIGFSIFFALAALNTRWFRPGLTAQTAAFAGMALGRIFGLIVDGSPETLLFALIAAESTGAIVGGLALWRLKKEQ